MKNEIMNRGITLISLVIMIILLIIFAAVSITTGDNMIQSAKFNKFKSELTLMHDKVNELNQNNNNNLGINLTVEQQEILQIDSISNIIFENKSQEQIDEIKIGFKYFTKEYIKTELNLDMFSRDFLINIDKRIIISEKPTEYEGIQYYMLEQVDNTSYIIEYNSKNNTSGNFDVTATNENDRCKIEISNITYNGYIKDWQVKYKKEGDSYWNTSNELTFYILKDGRYNIRVVHGDEIVLNEKIVNVLTDGLLTDKIVRGDVEIGDYVYYPLASVNTASILSELGTYSGSTSNTSSTLVQENLNWRVLDIVDGKVRLISEVPTNSEITLYGGKGYNNLVYLVDKVCNTLYLNSTYAEKVQNLKIEDIQKYTTYDYTQQPNSYVDTRKYGGTKEYTTNKYYPSLFAIEKNQWVDGIQGTQLGLSEQVTPITQDMVEAGSSIKMTQTYWGRTMVSSIFNNPKYFELFINNGNMYSTYWLSSRCVDAYENDMRFYGDIITENKVYITTLCYSSNYSYGHTYSFRPVITLNSNLRVNTSNTSKDGTTSGNALILQ